MKGFLYEDQLGDGEEGKEKEISVPEADVSMKMGLLGRFTVIGTGKQLSGKEPVKEVEVPDDLVAAAQDLVKAQIKFGSMRQIFENLTKE